MIGTDPATDFDARTALRGLQRMADQFTRARPIEAAAALRRVHGFRDAQTEIPKIVTEMDCLFPIDRRVQPGIGVGQRIGHNMRSRKRDAIEILGGLFGGKNNRLACRIRLEPAIGCWQNERGHSLLPIV